MQLGVVRAAATPVYVEAPRRPAADLGRGRFIRRSLIGRAYRRQRRIQRLPRWLQCGLSGVLLHPASMDGGGSSQRAHPDEMELLCSRRRIARRRHRLRGPRWRRTTTKRCQLLRTPLAGAGGPIDPGRRRRARRAAQPCRYRSRRRVAPGASGKPGSPAPLDPAGSAVVNVAAGLRAYEVPLTGGLSLRLPRPGQ